MDSACQPCPPGTSCGLGSIKPDLCPPGTFAPEQRSAQCSDCPLTATGTLTTKSWGTDGLEGCVCKAGRYDRDARANVTECVDCPGSTNCAEVGVELESLPLKSGYWRSFDRSEIILPCYEAELCNGSRTSCGTDGADGEVCDGYCSALRRGPYCDLCVDGCDNSSDTHGFCVRPTRIRATDGSCTECNGSIVLALIYPLVVLLIFIVVAVCSCRGGPKSTSLIDTVLESAKSGDQSSILSDEVQSALEEEAIEEAKTRATSISEEVDERTKSARRQVKEVTIVAKAIEVGQSKRSSLALSRQKSFQQAKEVAAKRGCTPERVSSIQVKFRILVSLVQVISQMGTVFSIPYPWALARGVQLAPR